MYTGYISEQMSKEDPRDKMARSHFQQWIIQKDWSATSQWGSQEEKTEVDRACFKDATRQRP